MGKKRERNVVRSEPVDYTPLIRSIQYLDAVLARGVIVSATEDGVRIDAKELEEALVQTRNLIDQLTESMAKAARLVNRVTHPTEYSTLQ